MINASDIRRRLSAVNNGALSLVDFEDWLDSESWNMHADSLPQAVELAEVASLLFSEYGLGYRDEPSLRLELRRLHKPITLESFQRIGPLTISTVEFPKTKSSVIRRLEYQAEA